MVFLPMSARQNHDGTLGLLKGALRGWHLLGDFFPHVHEMHMVRCRHRSLSPSHIDLAPAEPPFIDIQLCEMWARPIGTSQNFTGHGASLVMLEGTVPHHVSRHDSSQTAKLSHPRPARALWPHDTTQRRFQWCAICYLEMTTFEGEEVLKI